MLRRSFNRRSLIDPCELAVESLFIDATDRHAFKVRLQQFAASDDALCRIVNMCGDACTTSQSHLRRRTLTSVSPGAVSGACGCGRVEAACLATSSACPAR
jgi:hypothetical protein